MKRIQLIGLLAALSSVAPAQAASNPFLGRWDMTVATQNGSYPGWMEVTEAGGNLAVRVQPRTGSVHPATNVKLAGSQLSLTVSEAIEDRPAVTWTLTATGGKLSGMQMRGGEHADVTGISAPPLDRKPPAAWSAPEPLFNGKDLTGWQPDNPANNRWAAEGGALVNRSKGANIRTTRAFDDFKLHVEYNCPQGGNSGIYLRGRYEIQVEYEPAGTNDRFHSMGAIYGFLAPSVELPKKPGQWESFDVTLVGRRVTIARNGVTVVDSQEIPGTTGGALDSREAEPGPLYIQGDHTGGMKYRNITIAVPRK